MATPKNAPGIEHEDRFAVVLYGGVSLAVYITGVCLELLNIVRATAPDRNGQPTGSELAYRLAGGLRATPNGADVVADAIATELVRYREAAKTQKSADADSVTSADEARAARLAEFAASVVPKRRFVVDVLSGSSAGGLNALFLAKALTHDQSIDHLRDFWADEGGFAEMLNDDSSADRHDERHRDHLAIDVGQPRSLLSGDLMLLKLRAALEKMDEFDPRADGARHLVDALDCYLTTTDLQGLLLPIRLSDERSVLENRHRSVFHLAFGTDSHSGSHLDHLNEKHNGDLAFIGRATSAHPAAFEAAQLHYYLSSLPEWEAGLNQPERRRRTYLADRISPKLKFGEDLWPEDDEPWAAHMAQRWYSDGGDMDNKPFTYVLEPLGKRMATVPVNRQLLYVEPDPDNKRPPDPNRIPAPTFGETTIGAFNLGRTENIREDIERVVDRNTTIRRMTRGFDDQIGVLGVRSGKRPPSDHAVDGETPLGPWLTATYGEIVQRSGVAELAYELHKTVWVGGEIGDLMATVAGYAPDSAQTRWIIDATQRWARDRYVPKDLSKVYDEPNVHRKLLLGVDLGYRLRRLMFVDNVLRRLQEAINDGDLSTLATRWQLEEGDVDFAELRHLRERLNETGVDLRCIGRRLREGRPTYAFGDREPVWAERDDWRTTWGQGDPGPDDDDGQVFERGATVLLRWENDLPRWSEHLESLAADEGTARYDPLASDGDNDDLEKLQEVVDRIAYVLEPWLVATSRKAQSTIGEVIGKRESLFTLVMAVYEHYHQFDHFVLSSWGNASGELTETEITRVSPLDAKRLVAASKTTNHEVHKLGGNALSHFGGFLDEGWRRNDILWGRLDAAEILLGRLLPGDESAELRNHLIDVAHDRILTEEWETVRQLPRLSSQPTHHDIPEHPDAEAARAFLSNDFNMSLELEHKVPKDVAGRTLDIVGRVARRHTIDDAEATGSSKRLGRVIALFVRTLRIGLPPDDRNWRSPYLYGQRVAYLAGILIGLAAWFYGFTRDAAAAGLATLTGFVSAAGFIYSFMAAGNHESTRSNVARLVGLLVPFVTLWGATWISASAALTSLAGLALVAIFGSIAAPAVMVWIASRRFFENEGAAPMAGRTDDRITIASNLPRSGLFDLLVRRRRLLTGLEDGAVVLRSDVELRAGSEFSFDRSADPVIDAPVKYRGQIIELVEDRRIVFRWGQDHKHSKVHPGEATVSVHLRDLPQGSPTGSTLVDIACTFDKKRNGDVPEHLRVFWSNRLKDLVENAPTVPSTTGGGSA